MDSSTLINYVLSNQNISVNVHNIPKITDHSIISINFGKNVDYVNELNFFSRKLNIDKFHEINLELIPCDWLFDSGNVNEIFSQLESNCGRVLNSNAPITEIQIKKNLMFHGMIRR